MIKSSFFRAAMRLGLAAVMSLGLAAAAQATEVIVKYKLAAGGQSAPIKIPVNVPVILIGNMSTPGDIGVAQLVIHSTADYMQWVGYSSYDGFSQTNNTNTYSASIGTYIISLDFDGDVELLMESLSSFVIHNYGSGTLSGEVKLIY
jgi:hypothetical protein